MEIFPISLTQKERLDQKLTGYTRAIISFDYLSQTSFVSRVEQLIENHEILRSTLNTDSNFNYPVLHIHGKSNMNIIIKKYSKDVGFENIIKATSYDEILDKDCLDNRFFFILHQTPKKSILESCFNNLFFDSYSILYINTFIFKSFQNPSKKTNEKISFTSYANWLHELQEDEEAIAEVKANHSFSRKIHGLDISFSLKMDEGPFTSIEPKVVKFNKEDSGLKELGIRKTESLLLTSLALVFKPYSSTREVTIGAKFNGRKYAELGNTLGPLDRFIPVNFNFGLEGSTFNLRQGISRLLEDISEAQEYMFSHINGQGDLPQVLFEYLNLNEIINDSKNFFWDSTEENTVWKLLAIESTNFLECRFFAPKEVENTPFLNILLSRFETFFTDLLTGEDRNVRTSYGTGRTERQLVSDFSKGKVYLKQYTFEKSFLTAVRNNPSGIAIQYGEKSLTYSQLSEVTTQIGSKLIKYLENKPKLAAFKLSSYLDATLIFVAGLRFGIGLVPIDDRSPNARVRYIIQDSGTSLYIYDENDENHLGQLEVQRKSWAQLKEDIKGEPLTNTIFTYDKSDLAYVLYTSGSTGKPKGVMVGEDSLMNYLNWSNNYYFNPGECSSFGVISPISFDLSMTGLLGTLTRGGTLHLFDPVQPEEVLKAVFSNPFIDAIKITPSHIHLLDDLSVKSPSINLVIIGGEKLLPDQIKLLRRSIKNSSPRLFNEYGPTECTVGCTVADISAIDANISIGKPIDNVQILVLDEYKKTVPIGVIGEVYIGGKCLSKGYTNSDLTSQNFVIIPGKDEKFYRSGDLGRWLINGDLDFCGRVDRQMKVNAYRIEPGDIENVFSSLFDKPSFAFPIQSPDGLGSYIGLAYKSKELIHFNEIRSTLLAELPDYMVPNQFLQVADFPLTKNGKVDVSCLTKLITSRQVQRIPPRSDFDKTILNYIQEILGIYDLNIEDHFFEVGGHSINAVKIISKLRNSFKVDISLQEFFNNLIFRDLIDLISKKRKDEPQVDRIQPVPEQDIYQVSNSQSRLWILNKFEENSNNYNVTGSYLLKGVIDIERLKWACAQTIKRHEILRTTFPFINETIVQKVHEPQALNIEFIENDIDLKTKTGKIDLMLKERIAHAFDLEKELPYKIIVSKISQDSVILTWILHHIACDAWSLEILYRDFILFYKAFPEEPKNIPKLTFQFKDFAHWQRKLLNRPELKKLQKHLIKKYRTASRLELNTPKIRPTNLTNLGKSVEIQFDKEHFDLIKEYAKSVGISVYMLMLTVTNILLMRYSGQKSIVLGTTVSGREDFNLENQVGFYVNTIPMLFELNSVSTLGELIGVVRKESLESLELGKYPFDNLVKDLEIERELNRHPLFDLLISYNNTESHNAYDLDLDRLEFQPYQIPSNISQFDITLRFNESGNQLYFAIEYSLDLFTVAWIERFKSHFMKILSFVLETQNMELDLHEIPYISEEEKRSVLETFNRTETNYPDNETLVSLFEKTVRSNPDQIILYVGNQSFTANHINRASNRLARYLREQYQIDREDVVGLLTVKNEWMIISILGILKAGAAYLPIDVSHPNERIQNITDDSRCKLLLVDRNYDKSPDSELSILRRSDIERILGLEGNDNNLMTSIVPGNLAYIIYTSGSTGTPKGVMIEHGSVVNRINWMRKYYHFSSSDIVLQKTPYVFDVSVWEIFLPLCYGIPMVLCEREKSYDVEALCNLIDKHKVTTIHFVPSMLHVFVSNLNNLHQGKISSLRRIIASGEVLHINTVNILQQKLNVKLHNLYGPTEATVDVTCHEVSKNPKTIPIGRPIDNTQIFILDSQFNPVPIGVLGELFISGVGVARGYLHNKELTESKFLSNPFRIGSEKMYRTGDLGYWDEDGQIHFKGRIDFQVKLRGYRIELGEIENSMLLFPNIKTAVAVLKSDMEQSYIVGYINEINQKEVKHLRTFLKSQLPDYMVPSYIVPVKAFKITSSGKIDRAKLPDLKNERIEVSITSPINNVEKKLFEIWHSVLKASEIERDQSFFELGGNSINATQVISRINSSLNVRLRLKSIFENNTIEQLAGFIEKQPKTHFESIPRITKRKLYDLSFAQRRIWLAQQIEVNSPAYNVNIAFRIKEEIHREFLEASLVALIKRHELFRIIICLNRGDLKYRVLNEEDVGFELKYLDMSSQSVNDNEIAELALKEGMKPFRLDLEIPIRALLVKITNKDYFVSINYHHIISDGWSNDLIINEIILNYFSFIDGNLKKLPKLSVRYCDYVAWHKNYLNSKEAELDKAYWSEKLRDIPLQKELPFTLIRPAIQTSNGQTITFPSSSNTSAALDTFAKQAKVTLFQLMLALTNLLIYKYTRETDILLGSDSIDRSHPDLELNIGLYLDIILLRNTFSETDTFLDLLAIVKKTAIEAQDHQRYPVDLIFSDLGVKRDVSRTPMFNYFILYQNFGKRKIHDDINLKEDKFLNKMEGIPVNLPTGKFDLTFIFSEDSNDSIVLTINFNQDLFHEGDIINLATRFHELVNQVLNRPDLPINEYTLFSKDDFSMLTGKSSVKYSKVNFIQEFRKQTNINCKRLAVASDRAQLSYGELNLKSNGVAARLKKIGIGNESIVPIFMDDSAEYIIALLAVLKLNATAVPLNPSWPENRVQSLIKDLNPKVILCKSDFIELFQQTEAIVISDFFTEHEDFELVSSPHLYNPYIIYTSGTSGSPKGVKGSYKGLMNRLVWMNDHFGCDSAMAVLQSTKNIYDSSLWQILWPLMNGGYIVIPDAERKMEVSYFQNMVSTWKIRTIDFVPSLFNEMMRDDLIQPQSIESVENIIIGGEMINNDITLEFKKRFPKIRITNLYGPTEASIGCIYHTVEGNEYQGIPIGKPISNVRIYILKDSEFVPPNVPGEIYISGDCLSYGYFNEPMKTAENFETITINNEIVQAYRTGDIGKINSEGNIEFLGRKDRQFKLNGIRIEPAEIESKILQMKEVEEVFVDLRKVGGKKVIVAYFTSEKGITNDYLKRYALDSLPVGLVPNFFIHLNHLPLTDAGKVDALQLPAPLPVPRRRKQNKAQVMSRTVLRLIEIWKEILTITTIESEDNFFELGGTSLEALRMIHDMNMEFNVNLRLRHLFENPTIHDISGIIESMEKENPREADNNKASSLR